MPQGIWVKDMPGYDDWVELHRPEMSEREARVFGETHVCLESGVRVTRTKTFELLDGLIVSVRRLDGLGTTPDPRSRSHLRLVRTGTAVVGPPVAARVVPPIET